jgi:hypothetical protein
MLCDGGTASEYALQNNAEQQWCRAWSSGAKWAATFNLLHSFMMCSVLNVPGRACHRALESCWLLTLCNNSSTSATAAL